MAAIEWTPPAVGLTGGTQANSYKQVFGYTNYGAVTRSKLTVDSTYTPVGQGPTSQQTVLQATFTWVMQGELASITYPDGRYLYYKFDAAGRSNGLHQNAGAGWNNLDLVSNTSFTPAGQLATLDFNPDLNTGYSPLQRETRSYNNLLQLTGIQVANAPPGSGGTLLDLSYSYPAGANNGRISAEINNLSGVQVDYTYDQQNRLQSAVSRTGGTTNWGLQFGYDVYGNRLSQTVTAGSAPQSQFQFDNNNRMIGYSYDGNGNQLSMPDGATLSYDADNRMTGWSRSGTTESYQYYPGGTRVWKSRSFASDSFGIFYLHGPSGQLLAERESATLSLKDYVYFGGRLLYSPAGTVYRDRLGSARVTGTPYSGYTTRNYYPFGEEIPQGGTAGNQYKFADTYRDSTTGLDYAINRYYASGTARFLTADPLGRGSAKLTASISWNLYVYSRNDPVNVIDPSGLDNEVVNTVFAQGTVNMCYEEGGTVYYGLQVVTGSRNENGNTVFTRQVFQLVKQEQGTGTPIPEIRGDEVTSEYTVYGSSIRVTAEVGPIGTQNYHSVWELSFRGMGWSWGYDYMGNGFDGKAFGPTSLDRSTPESYSYSEGNWSWTHRPTGATVTGGTFQYALHLSLQSNGNVVMTESYLETYHDGSGPTSLSTSAVFDSQGMVSLTRTKGGKEFEYFRCK